MKAGHVERMIGHLQRMAEPPQSKIAGLRAAWAAGDKVGALRIAARFADLGAEREAILSGWGAFQNPAFYRQVRKDPEALVASAFAALAKRYELEAANGSV